jgi:hypothetical protein
MALQKFRELVSHLAFLFQAGVRRRWLSLLNPFHPGGGVGRKKSEWMDGEVQSQLFGRPAKLSKSLS